MNILQTTLLPVYPPTSGGDHRSHGILTAFRDSGDTVNRFTQGVDIEQYQSLGVLNVNKIQERYFEYQYKNPFHSLFRLNLLVGFPYIHSGNLLQIWKPKRLKRLVDNADIVLSDVPSHIYALTKYTNDTPLVYSSHNVESERFEPKNYRFGKFFHILIKREEKKAINNSDMIICTSERDKRMFENKYDYTGDIFVSPNGIYNNKIRMPDNQAGRRIRKKYGISEDIFTGLFVGSNYGPNNDAADTVVEIAKEMKNIHILVVGSVSDTLSNTPKNITSVGFVDEIEPYYDAADFALNPMRYGGGTNIKILDYWARSLPVLSTPFGVRGFNLPDDETVMIANISSFPDKIKELQSNPSLRNTLGNNARRFVGEKYIWKTISEDLRQRIISKYVI